MGFEQRVNISNLLAELLGNYLWEECKALGVKLARIGYEKTIPEDVVDMLKEIEDPTSYLVRVIIPFLFSLSRVSIFLTDLLPGRGCVGL